MRPWHDFHIVGYAVDGARQELVFDLEWPYDTPTDVKRVRVVFEAVEGYFLEHDLGGNIVFDFAERALRPFLEEWAERFDLSSREAGWPRFWLASTDLDKTCQPLLARGVKCVELSSSYGLSGWILAASVREDVIDAN